MDFTHIMTDTDHLPLTAIKHSWIQDIVQIPAALHGAIQDYGSPVNIQSLVPFEENIVEYEGVFRKYDLKHRIYFARKANKCLTFAKHAASQGQGVDTASYQELQQCLDAGISADQLISTAAVKTRQLLDLAVRSAVTIVIDNMDELSLLEEVCEEHRLQANISLRIGGFEVNGNRMHSRFGFSIDEAKALVLDNLATHTNLIYTGLHFHLNGYSVSERAIAIGECIGLIDHLTAHDIETFHVDIGGGYLVNYLEDENQWQNFQDQLKLAILDKRPELTYRNDPLGIINIEGTLHGEAKVYPYYNKLHKGDFLESILGHYVPKYKEPIHQLLRDRDIEIRIEPGRSLLDQAGITVARVAFRKHDSAGNLLVGLEMNRTQMKSSSADFLLDPIHIRSNQAEDEQPIFGYLVGAYCLEQELILLRKIKFESMPQVGDLMVFLNTAGYMMHFFESQAHQFDLAKNVFYDGSGHFTLES